METLLPGILFWLSILSVIYVNAGYPILVTLFAKLKPRIAVKDNNVYQPHVTLLIAAYNEAGVIAGKLENSLNLDYDREKLQILAAADGSDDGTLEIVKSFASRGVQCSYAPQRRGKMAAINRAMSRVEGEIVIFSDANNLYDKNTIRHLIAPFAERRWGAVSGAKQISETGDAIGASESIYWKYESFIKEQETRLGTCTAVAGEILAIRRSLYSKPPDNIINDDFSIAMSILNKGYDIYYQPKARSYESASQSAAEEILRRTRIVAGRYQAMSMAHRYLSFRRPVVAWQLFSHKFARPLVPIWMLAAFFLNILCLIWPYKTSLLIPAILGLASPFNWILFILQFIFYAIAIAGNWIKKPKGTAGKILYLATFLVNSNLAALPGLFKYLTGKQTALWKKARR